MPRERIKQDVLIIGAGPAGLSAALRLRQLIPDLQVCIVEKGAAVGAHILSGAVIDTHALDELLPNWTQLAPPITIPVKNEQFLYLTKRHALKLPIPITLNNHGNYIISLGKLCRWLAEQATQLGIEIYTGFAAQELLFSDSGAIQGVVLGDLGLDAQGNPLANYSAGIEIIAKQTLIAEGCHGSLSKKIIQHFSLNQDKAPQTYSLGIKELWRVPEKQHQPGTVVHTMGWPLAPAHYGGAFIYHLEDHLVAIGMVMGLDYVNPYLDPHAEMQQLKTHPAIRLHLMEGQRLSYGARTLITGGIQSLPKLTFPGGMLLGDSAGWLNVAKIKGIHTAMKSGMLAAEVIADSFKSGNISSELTEYFPRIQNSWLWQEAYRYRNIRPAFRYGLWVGLAYAALDAYLFKGNTPWTLYSKKADYQSTFRAKNCKVITYPKPDNILTFDKLSSVYLSNTHHRENQPCHLQLQDPEKAIRINWQQYHSPEQYYCPAGVYEILQFEDKTKLQINPQNCLHCKACDIKDPIQNITWIPPEGKDGPNYQDM